MPEVIGCSECSERDERIQALEKEVSAWRQIDKIRVAVLETLDD